MNSGWAVVLGAVIALMGSAIIPWIRDSRTAARRRREDAETRRNTAIVDLIAANSALAFANVFQDKERVTGAYEERSRAAAALVLEAGSADREDLAVLLDAAAPIRTDKRAAEVTPRVGMLAFQLTLTAWGTGDLAAAELAAAYRKNVGVATERLHAAS